MKQVVCLKKKFVDTIFLRLLHSLQNQDSEEEFNLIEVN